MRAYRWLLLALLVMAVLAGVSCNPGARAETCEPVVHALNERLHPGINEEELVSVLRPLAASGNRKLPPNFVTKGQARKRGWQRGRSPWRGSSVPPVPETY